MVTLLHWATKINLESGNLKQLSTMCLTNVNTLLNKLQHDLSKVDQLAELYYLLRLIDCRTLYWDAERGLRQFKEMLEKLNKPEEEWSLPMTQYYVRTLIAADEH